VLPPWLGRWYVTQVRKRPRYEVGVFPVGARVVSHLQKLGFTVFEPAPRTRWVDKLSQGIALRFGSMFLIHAQKKLVGGSAHGSWYGS
jgi:hypothetical protein